MYAKTGESFTIKAEIKDRNRNNFPICLRVPLRGFAKQSRPPAPGNEIASSKTPRNDTFGEVISVAILR